jgi:uncharacterized protein (TIGR03067 family)
MRWLCLSLALLFSAMARADDQQGIQGTWYCLTIVPSKVIPGVEEAMAEMKKMSMTFKGNSVVMDQVERKKEGTFILDTTTSPKRLVIQEQGQDQLKAVYSLDKDLLVLTFNEGSSEYPKGFSVTSALKKGGMIVMQKSRPPHADVANKPAITGRPAVLNNAKQLGVAVHNYYAAMNKMPRNITDKAGKPLLSWRVHLLPYLEHDALYRQFKLDEPWNSEHNKTLLSKMPAVFAVDASDEKNHTSSFRPFEGTHTPFEPGKDIRFSQIYDGLSNTLMFVESAEGSIWTKPEDLLYAAGQPLPKLGGRAKGQIAAVLLDGFVIVLPDTVPEATLRAMITRDGGEVVEIPNLNAKPAKRTVEKVERDDPPARK